MTISAYRQARLSELVAQSCRVLGSLSMTHGALGHVSYRLDDDTFLIKGKGAQEEALRFTEPKDIIRIDFEGNTVDGPEGLRAPSESFIHIAIFMAHPEAKTVIHCHPKAAVVLTACDLELVPLYGQGRPGAMLAIEGVPTYQRSHRILSLEMGKEFVDVMGDHKVALMRGHGISVYGSGVEDASVRALALNELLTMNYEARAVGVPKPIPEGDHEDLYPAVRPLGSLGGHAAVLAEWRYYCKLAGEEAISVPS